MTERRNTQRKRAVINAVKQVQGPFTAEQLFHMAKACSMYFPRHGLPHDLHSS